MVISNWDASRLSSHVAPITPRPSFYYLFQPHWRLAASALTTSSKAHHTVKKFSFLAHFIKILFWNAQHDVIGRFYQTNIDSNHQCDWNALTFYQSTAHLARHS